MTQEEQHVEGYNRYDPIYVEWIDTTEEEGWVDKDVDITLSDMVVKSVGLFLSNERGRLLFCKDVTQGSHGDVCGIPLQNIITMRKLR